jgi:hypothetical protein
MTSRGVAWRGVAWRGDALRCDCPRADVARRDTLTARSDYRRRSRHGAEVQSRLRRYRSLLTSVQWRIQMLGQSAYG